MNLQEIEKYWEQVKKNPVKSLFLTLIALLLTIGGIWGTAYISELGSGFGQLGTNIKDAELQIMDVVVTNDPVNGPNVDVKYQNTGERNAVITELTFQLLERHGERPFNSGSNYDMLINSNTTTKKIMSTVEPDHAGMESAVLGTSLPYNAYKFRAILAYNGEKRAISEPFFITF